jgi:hypothetical protein
MTPGVIATINLLVAAALVAAGLAVYRRRRQRRHQKLPMEAMTVASGNSSTGEDAAVNGGGTQA